MLHPQHLGHCGPVATQYIHSRNTPSKSATEAVNARPLPDLSFQKREVKLKEVPVPYQFIKTETEGGVLVITLDDPRTRNAIGNEMGIEVHQELARFESDPTLRCLVITGRDPAFCSGANVRGMNEEYRGTPADPTLADSSPWEMLAQKWEEGKGKPAEEIIEGPAGVPIRLYNLQKPTIAAVNGYAMGLGLGIALSCDIRIASVNARMSETFVRRGLTPGDGSAWQLPRLIGLSNTLLLQYTGDIVEPQEALRMGLVSKVTPHEELMSTTMKLAERLAQGPTYAMALTKKLVQASLNVNFAESLQLGRPAQQIARSTQDFREGIRAFVEKRTPQFKGH
ncbi:MAG: hypothetical protein EXR67_06615 [Dehalococcoidia bacterium]|nr:hypothetical protein [Dehalococcoidia bacterium]